MIIGNGLIGKALYKIDNNECVFFASGVSNSSEKDKFQFKREKDLLINTLEKHPKKKILYLSTASIYDSSLENSPYINHKLAMESLVSNHSEYLIFRISNATGSGGNPNTLMNYIKNCIIKNQTINIYSLSSRNIINVKDVVGCINYSLEKKIINQVVNIAYPNNFNISELVLAFEKYLNKTTTKNTLDKGVHYNIDITNTIGYFKEYALLDKNQYLQNILKDYF